MNQKAASSMLWRLTVSSPWFRCRAARTPRKAAAVTKRDELLAKNFHEPRRIGQFD
jgi:hypothetical protein